MNEKMIGRRNFLKQTGMVAAATLSVNAVSGTLGATPAQAQEKATLKKAIQSGMLPEALAPVDRFKLAKNCGFEAVEMSSPVMEIDAAKKLADEAATAGIRIHSVVFGGWKTPFSDPDPKVVEAGLKDMEATLRGAKALGADAVLLVPAIVNEKVRYAEAYERSQANIRKLLPLAEELKVIIAVEYVWNKFLLSPLEFARYVDELNSPWLKAYFDTGNVVISGYPQDWIRTLGKRTVKIHLKDFRRKGYEFVNLFEGDVDFKEVRRALSEVGYSGYLTPELKGGDEAYLRNLSGQIDKIIAG